MRRRSWLVKLAGEKEQFRAIGFVALAVSSFYAAMSFFAVAMFYLGVDKDYYNWQPWDIVLQPAKAFIGVGLGLLIISVVALGTVEALAVLGKCWRKWTRTRL